MFYLINVSEFLTVVSAARFGEPAHKARLLINSFFKLFFLSLSHFIQFSPRKVSRATAAGFD